MLLVMTLAKTLPSRRNETTSSDPDAKANNPNGSLVLATQFDLAISFSTSPLPLKESFGPTVRKVAKRRVVTLALASRLGSRALHLSGQTSQIVH
jgi:hypothetical protein